jgi:hypothetical protein
VQTLSPYQVSEKKRGIVMKYCRRQAAIAVRDLGDEVLVLDMTRNQIHQLNRTASFIWHKCAGPASAEDIAAAVVKAFDVANDTAMADVERVLGQLRELDLLMGVDGIAR